MPSRASRSVAFAIALVVVAPAVARAQVVSGTVQGTPVLPPRDRVPPPTTGTGVIKGRVVDGVTGAAVARARVRIMGGATRLPVVTTDAAGVFTFRNLPPGGFTLAADKPTYLSSRYPEAGRTLRGSMGKPLVLGAGETVNTVSIALFHAGAITGRVLDANGDLVESAEVRLMSVSPGGKPQMRNGGSSNDIGEFRIGRLNPGTYLLLASSRRNPVDDQFGPNAALPAEVPAQPVPTYYPGVPALDLAQPIRIERGQTVSDIDITLAEAVPSVVTGTVVGEDGQPLTTGGFLSVRTTLKDMTFPVDTGGTSVRPDGTFRLTLAPGDYVLEARANSSGGPGAPYVERTGMARVNVAGNVEGLTIAIGRLATAAGKVVFEGSAALPPNPQQMSFPLFSSGEGMNCRQGRMTMTADWTFTIEGLAGTCARPPMTGFGAWTLKSVQINGEEFEDDSITFEPGQRLRNVQVTLTDRRIGATFNVSDESGQATREYVGIVFQVSKGQVQQSSIRTVVPPTDEMIALALAANPGRQMPSTQRIQSIQTLGPGDYYAIAIDDIAGEDSRDPSILARLIPSATRVTINEVPDTQISVRRQKLADLLKR
jgi:hypothetical protein